MVQVFLPYESASTSIKRLDLIRLGKQREEILEMLEVITNPDCLRYRYHPTVRMWRPYPGTLCAIGMMSCIEFKKRGRAETALPAFYDYMDDPAVGTAWVTPPWFEDVEFHKSHRSRLIAKKPLQYARLWPGTPVNMPYLYPRKNDWDSRGYKLFLSLADRNRLVMGQRVLPPYLRFDPDTLEVRS